MKRFIAVAAVVALALAGATILFMLRDLDLARAQTPALLRQAQQTYGRAVPLAALSPERRDILLRIEDPAFYRHRGVDLETPGAGMTTITQGLVKLLYFPEGFRPGLRKFRQTLIAQYAFDAQVPKDEQLELYLNATYFGTVEGRAIHGLEAAAQTYFGKPFAALDDDAFIALIGMTIRPDALKPGTAESAARVAAINRYLAGTRLPGSLLDVEYTGSDVGTMPERTLAALLRLMTHSTPAPGR